MKKLFNKAVRKYLEHRYLRIERMKADGERLQEEVLMKLLKRNRNTEIGRKYTFESLLNSSDYKEVVPIRRYEDIVEDVLRMMDGASDVLCNGTVKTYAKSSGTTNDSSKYLPMPKVMHQRNHVAASWDTMAMLYHEDESAEIFSKKSTIMGGALTTVGTAEVGDVSAILLNKMHWAGRPFFTPDFATATMGDWGEKIDRMAEICSAEPVVMVGGVPSWTMVLCQKILEHTGKNNMLEVWPTAKYYMHGGVGFEPYRDQFRRLFPSDTFRYYEVYNASEGYFAVQDSYKSDGMLLLLDNEIYYEFVKLGDINVTKPTTLTLDQVELGVSYAIVITTAGGLWRYMVGDTIIFTSKAPYRIKVSGRTKQFINLAGEELMVANAEMAIAKTSSALSAEVAEYTVAPVPMDVGVRGHHHWVVEFKKDLPNIQDFADKLDRALRAENSDYDAKRSQDLVLDRLQLTTVRKGTFHRWMQKQGKFGGQHKVPRLSTDDRFVREIININNNG